MLDQYFGIKELYQVTLRAKAPMQFGTRHIEAEEPVLYFEKVNMATLREVNRPIMARGGWANMPHVIWEDRSEVEFSMSEGVMSSIGMGVLLSAHVTESSTTEPLLVPKREGPYTPFEKEIEGETCNIVYLDNWPSTKKKVFIFDYDRKVAQRKIYGKYIHNIPDQFDDTKERPCVALYKDKELTEIADLDRAYIVDYYYQYTDEALVYTVQKERFNGLFTLEGKFYSKDENDGVNYTNLLYMPKVRVVSDIDLRLGERADPTTSVFNIIGLPENTVNHRDGLILEIWRLNDDIDAGI